MSNYIDDNKRVLKNSLYLYVRLGLSIIIGLYTSRIILDSLGIDDYGLYNIVGGFVIFLSVLSASMTSSSNRFLAYELGSGDVEKLSLTFSTLRIMFIWISFVIFIIGIIVGTIFIRYYLNITLDKYNVAYFVYFCSLLVFCFDILASPYTGLIMAHEHINFYAIMSIFASVGKLLIVLSLYLFESNRLYYYAAFIAGLSIIMRIIYEIYCKIKFPETKFKWTFRKSIFFSVFNFSFWNSLGTFAGILKDHGINILFNIFFGVVLNAAKGISNQVVGLMQTMSSNLGSAITPQIIKSYAAGDVNRAERLTFFMAKAEGFMMLFIIAPLFFQIEFLLDLWLKKYPDYTPLLIRWSLVIAFFKTITSAYMPLLSATGKVKIQNIIGSSISIFLLPTCFIALKFSTNINICMFVCFIFEFILFIESYLMLWVTIKFPVISFFKEVIFRLLFIAIINITFTYIVTTIKIHNIWGNFIVITTMCCLSNVILCYAIGLSKSERIKITQYLAMKINRTKFKVIE